MPIKPNPKLPAQLNSGPMGQVLERQKLRVAEMQRLHPGVSFSPGTANEFAVKQNESAAGVGLPRAIFNLGAVAITSEALVSKFITEYRNLMRSGSSGYITYTQMHYSSGIEFDQIFGVLNGMRKSDPNSVNFTVDRLGKNTAFKLNV
jgi:hypothetical protein